MGYYEYNGGYNEHNGGIIMVISRDTTINVENVIDETMEDTAKEGLTQFLELFTVILCMLKDFKC